MKRKMIALALCIIMLAMAAPLAVFAAPFADVQIRTGSITSTSVILDGQATVPAGTYNEIIARGFIVSTRQTERSSNYFRNIPDSRQSTFNMNITGLNPDTTYFVTAFVRYADNDNVLREHFSIERVFQTTAAPMVTTTSAHHRTSDNNMVTEATIAVPNINEVTRRGFVHSTVSNTPTQTTTGTTTINVDGTGTTMNTSFAVPLGNRTYYVRSFIVIGGQTIYGNVIAVSVGEVIGAVPTVQTVNVEDVTNVGASIRINVINPGATAVTERGVVFSRQNTQPRIGQTNSEYVIIDGTMGTGRITLADLELDRRYYVVAFARNQAGVGYGEVMNFTTRRDMVITTTEVTEVTNNSAMVTANLTSLRGDLRERGFVFSSENSVPTLDSDEGNNRRVSMSASAAGDFSMPITGLTTNTDYYVRAFAISSEGISYGNVIEFTTTPVVAQREITLSFTRTDGQMVSRQVISRAVGATITATDLQIPPGYQLVDPQWSQTIETATPTELLVSIRTTAPAQRQEQVFMAGVGGFRFEPDRGATRAEVAQVIYNLAADRTMGQPMTFTDVPAHHANRRAIDFVSARRIMQGYPDGTFMPDATISRAEIAAVLSNVYSLTGTGVRTFTDMHTHPWAQNFVSLAADRGIINGFPDNTFRPAENVTRAQVVTLFSNAEGRTLAPLGTINFSDVPPTHWAHRQIMNASIALP